MTDPDPLLVADQTAWRRWLDQNEDVSDGVWVVLAKKGHSEPTSLRYDQALDEARAAAGSMARPSGSTMPPTKCGSRPDERAVFRRCAIPSTSPAWKPKAGCARGGARR